MDTHPPAAFDDDVERRLLEKAVAEALANPGPGRPHQQVAAEMERMIEEIEQEIVTRLAE
jgi:hypothetical protein